MFECGHGDSSSLAIYGSHRMAVAYAEQYNKEWAWLGLVVEVWAYWGSKPLGLAPDEWDGLKPPGLDTQHEIPRMAETARDD